MRSSQLSRISGLALLVGAIAFAVHIVARSLITAGADPASFAKQPLWMPISALGAVGSLLVLLGLPAIVARMAGQTGLLGLVGVVLIVLAWVFFGVFLSLYSMLVAPWLADEAPALVGASAPIPAAFVVAFVAGLVADLAGTVLLAIPFLRRRVRPRWIGYLLPASAVLTVVGDLIAPNGPAANVAINLISNLGPMLLLVALGALGSQMWRANVPAQQDDPIT
jgi:hypothetical protein